MLEVTIQTYSCRERSLRVTYIGGCIITYHYYSSAQPIFFASGTRNFVLTKPRGSLRLVDLSRIPSGTFFREVLPSSETWCLITWVLAE